MDDAVPEGLFRPFGRPRWPWRVMVLESTQRAPLVCLNRRPGQAVGVYLRLPDGRVASPPRDVHLVLSILWARPDVRAYPKDVALPIRGPRWQ